MPPAMQRIREALWLSKVKFIEEEKKNAKGFVVGAKFIVPASVLTDVIFKADHEQGKAEFPDDPHVRPGRGVPLGSGARDQRRHARRFAKALIGQQSEIRKYRVAGAPGMFR